MAISIFSLLKIYISLLNLILIIKFAYHNETQVINSKLKAKKWQCIFSSRSNQAEDPNLQKGKKSYKRVL